MLDKLFKVFDEGLLTTVAATLIVTEAMDVDLEDILSMITFGGYDVIKDDIVPYRAKAPIGTVALVWAAAYMAGMLVEKGISIPFTDYEIGGYDLPIFETSEDSLF